MHPDDGILDCVAEELIPVKTYSRPIEAELARSKLEAEGLRCFIADGNIVRLNWYLSGAVGGTKLLVRAADRAHALEILDEDPAQAEEALREIFGDMEGSGCPRCGSDEVRPQRHTAVTVVIVFLCVGLLLGQPLLFLLMGLPVLLPRPKRTRCLDCGHRWKRGSEEPLRLDS